VEGRGGGREGGEEGKRKRGKERGRKGGREEGMVGWGEVRALFREVKADFREVRADFREVRALLTEDGVSLGESHLFHPHHGVVGRKGFVQRKFGFFRRR